MPRERTPTVHPILLWPFTEAVRKLGFTIPEWPGLGPSGFGDSPRIPHERAQALLALAVQSTRRDDLGVLAAEAVEPGHFELVELASRAQRSVGEGLTTLSALVSILHDGLSVKLLRAPKLSKLRITLGDDVALHPAGYDFMVASLVIGGRRQTRIAELCPSLVRMPYPEPKHAPALARLLSCPIEFGAECLELEFPTADLEIALTRADASMGQVLHDAARELIDHGDKTSELVRSVRERVREKLASNAVDAQAVARALHMSERTLRRRLQAEGLGLRELVDDVRRELALEKLVDASLSTEAVASQLGFTTPQAFHRAFRRWTGGTVQAYRARR